VQRERPAGHNHLRAMPPLATAGTWFRTWRLWTSLGGTSSA
jgi:hypothetical protein